jgi:uncharacterized PurR-regulated membrane protein YhhQ (DUF165 family)
MSDGRRPRPLVLGLAVLVILLAITSVVVQYTISDSLGHALTGGAVLGAVILSAIGLRKRPT